MIYLAYAVALLLALVCLFAVLAILMQRPSANAGMGAALGGGAAESVLGGDAANFLNKITYGLISAFFILCFGLYLGFLANSRAKSRLTTLDQITQGAPITSPNPTIAPAPESKPGETTVPAATPADSGTTTPSTPTSPAPVDTTTTAPVQTPLATPAAETAPSTPAPAAQ